jgi:hypothetical protein
VTTRVEDPASKPSPHEGPQRPSSAIYLDVELAVHDEVPIHIETDVKSRGASTASELYERLLENLRHLVEIVEKLGRDLDPDGAIIVRHVTPPMKNRLTDEILATPTDSLSVSR